MAYFAVPKPPKVITAQRLRELTAEASDPVCFVTQASAEDLKLALQELERLRHAHMVMRKSLLKCANVLFSIWKGRDVVRMPKVVWECIDDTINDAKKVLDV